MIFQDFSYHLNFIVLLIQEDFVTMACTDETIISKVDRGVGWILLNRPRALNALSLDMIRMMTKLLTTWNLPDSGVKLIIVKGSGERAFCSGGDIKSIASAKGEKLQEDFIREEYQLDNLIGNLRIPYVAIVDGITMGGGVGISIHGKFRVGTEKTVFAMPECGIGLIPDVGASYFLPRLGGSALGLFLGLTGHRVMASECQKLGITTHNLKSSELECFEKDVYELVINKDEISDADVRNILDSLNSQGAVNSQDGFIASNLDKINQIFNSDSLAEIYMKLEEDRSEFSIGVLEAMKKNSPLSMRLTFKQLKNGQPSRAEALITEHRLMTRRFQDPDFYEGVRAALIDKDHSPKWKPEDSKSISNEEVENYFSKLEHGKELVL